MMKATVLFAMVTTITGLRRAPPMPQQVHINPLAHAGIDDVDFDLEYELLETKYRDGIAQVKRVVKKVEDKTLKWVPAKGVLFGIEHVEDLDQICFLE